MLEETDLIIVAQTLLIKCLDNDSLCNEIFLQLMKQTTRPSSGKYRHIVFGVKLAAGI